MNTLDGIGFEDLLGRYWDIAYCEGRDKVNLADEANEVLNALRKIHSETKWIDRSKRNPKERGEYLVYRSEVFQMDLANFGTSKGWDNGRHKGDSPYRVTHWFKLPDAPE